MAGERRLVGVDWFDIRDSETCVMLFVYEAGVEETRLTSGEVS
jgi:hypothetical protein